MANLIILEGLSRTGKSTISKSIAEEFGFRNFSIKTKMPEYVENLPDFYHGMHILANELFKTFPNETFILDRSFLSELVYSKFFDRKSYINNDQIISDLLLDNKFLLVLLDNNHQQYINRGPKDKIVYDEREFINQKDLFQWHFHTFRDKYEPESWRNQFLYIDTSITNLTETTEQIKIRIKQIL
jgi:thymidylate kinase